MAKPGTTIHVSEETWRALMMRKSPGDTFDDVVSELIQENEAFEEKFIELRDRVRQLEE